MKTKQRMERRAIIEKVKRSVEKAKNKDFQNTVLIVMSSEDVSRRTARELSEVAFLELGLPIQNG